MARLRIGRMEMERRSRRLGEENNCFQIVLEVDSSLGRVGPQVELHEQPRTSFCLKGWFQTCSFRISRSSSILRTRDPTHPSFSWHLHNRCHGRVLHYIDTPAPAPMVQNPVSIYCLVRKKVLVGGSKNLTFVAWTNIWTNSSILLGDCRMAFRSSKADHVNVVDASNQGSNSPLPIFTASA